MRDTCPISQNDAQASDGESVADVAATPPPADLNEMDVGVARQLLPAIVRLATRRLGAPEGEAAHALGDEDDA